MILSLILLSWLAAVSAAAGTIVVDTGHSSGRAGSVAADGTPEFALNRAMAVALIDALRDRGHTVVDVHREGGDNSLVSRTAKTAGADLFLSIHHDSIQQRYLDEGRAHQFSGFSVFISGMSRALEGSMRCSLNIGEAMLAAGESPSRYHAEPIKGENKPLLDTRRGIHRFDNLVVLKASQAPAVLLEVGVSVNPMEIIKLKDPLWRTRVAHTLASSIGACVS